MLMTAVNKKYYDYSTECEFQVGERVHVELPQVPVEQRETTTGIIVKIDTMFPTTPEHRKIRYTIRFDGKGNYIKKEYRMAGGIKFQFTCVGTMLRKLQNK